MADLRYVEHVIARELGIDSLVVMGVLRELARRAPELHHITVKRQWNDDGERIGPELTCRIETVDAARRVCAAVVAHLDAEAGVAR